MSGEDDENELVEQKWVRIFGDSSADGVWTRDGGATSADSLPVDQALVDRVRAWQAWYDRDENDWGVFKGNVEAFSTEGREIARAMKAALPDWTVIYFDEAAFASASDDAPRTVFEYEV